MNRHSAFPIGLPFVLCAVSLLWIGCGDGVKPTPASGSTSSSSGTASSSSSGDGGAGAAGGMAGAGGMGGMMGVGGNAGNGGMGGTGGMGGSGANALLFNQIDVGWATSCGIDVNSGLWCWGRNQDGVAGIGQKSIIEDVPRQIAVSGWRQISAGYGFACGVRTDDTLWCWGRRDGGRLGIGAVNSGIEYAPIQVGTDTNWLEVETGTSFTLTKGTACAIRTDGTLWCWGNNAAGQHGTGNTTNSLVPVQSGVDMNWKQVSVGGKHTCGRKMDGSAYCWGDNTARVLGEFAGPSALTAVEVLAGAKWRDISAGYSISCGIRDDGTLWCWGVVKCCNGTPPAQIGVETTWVDVDVSANRLCATRADGTLWCKDDNVYGQAGLPAPAYLSTLTQVPGSSWSSVHTSEEHTCVRETSGRVRCFGANFYGELGRGTSSLKKNPEPLPYNDWMVMRTSGDTACGLRAGGSLWCWGQTGLFPARTSSVPVDMLHTGFKRLEAGNEAQCGIKNDDTLWCWGKTYFMSGLGIQSEPKELIPGSKWLDVALGQRHTCGIKTDHTVWCWGANPYGQVGNGTTIDVLDATQVGTDSDWNDVFAGGQQTCGIKMDGTLWCWGGSVIVGLTSSANTEVTTPVKIGSDTDWVSGSMLGHICVIKSSGALHCAGSNDYGQLGDPARMGPDWALTKLGTDSWTAVATDQQTTCAVRADKTLWCWGNGSYGQLGNGLLPNSLGTPLVQNTPKQVGTDADWEDIQMTLRTTYGLRNTGRADCLGHFIDGADGRGDSWSADHWLILKP